MDVLLDTNAIRASGGIESSAFKALMAYVKRTRSQLLLPSVVVEELCAQRRLAIEKLEKGLEDVYKELHKLFPDITTEPPALDSGLALTNYRQQVLTSADKIQIIENLPEDLSELVLRLANRLPPASLSGEEARDVLMWLPVIRLAHSGRFAFITADQKAFSQSGSLRPELVAELGDHRDNIEVFLRIDDFLRLYHARSSFIDEAWVNHQIETEQFIQDIRDFIGEDYSYWKRIAYREITAPIQQAWLTQIVQHEIEDFFVSDLTPDELYVSATVWAELELEVHYSTERDEDYYRQQDKWGLQPKKWKTYFQYIYPCVIMKVDFIVAEEALKSIEVTEMEIKH